MKSKKFLIAISLVLSMFLVLSMSFSLFSCGENDELLERIEELSTKIQAQEKSVEDLQEENEALKEANEALQEKNEDLTERLTEIEWTYNAPYGYVYYSLEEMYEKRNYIDKQALMNIAYHLNGGKEGNEEIMADFEPTPLEPLSAEMERRIRETFAYWGRSSGEHLNSPESWKVWWIDSYLGRYNFGGGYAYVVQMDSYGGHMDVVTSKYIDGIYFCFPTSDDNISVYIEWGDE